MLGYGTNASFTLRKVHEKIFSKKKKKNNLYFAFVELKKVFDQRGPWDVRHTWWPVNFLLQKLGELLDILGDFLKKNCTKGLDFRINSKYWNSFGYYELNSKWCIPT